MRFARDLGLTIRERSDLPEEWKVQARGFDSVLDELAHWKERAEAAEKALAETEEGIRRIGIRSLIRRPLGRPTPET